MDSALSGALKSGDGLISFLPQNKAPVCSGGRGEREVWLVGRSLTSCRDSRAPPLPSPASASRLCGSSCLRGMTLRVCSGRRPASHVHPSLMALGISFLLSARSLPHIPAAQFCGCFSSALPPFPWSLLARTHFSVVSEQNKENKFVCLAVKFN